MRHLAYNCKPLEQGEEVTIGLMDMEQGGDDDDQYVALKKIQLEKAAVTVKKPKAKVVNF